MPELPDVELYRHALAARVVGHVLTGARIPSPSLVRTAVPSWRDAVGRPVTGVERLGKRIVLAFEGDLFYVIHLMIAGRFQWAKAGAAVPRKRCHAGFDFDHGTLLLTEASTRKRASLHVVSGRDGLAAHDPGGLEVLGAEFETFRDVLTRTDHTLKRALTDPRLLSGIGNAYSDEILHHARLSPVQRVSNLDDTELRRLFDSIREVLTTWTERLRAENGDAFPKKVTAFRPEMAVHGRFRQPCPDCASPVQRIVYADRELNYCARCQTGGRLLKDRALSRLLKEDWPATLEEMG